MDALLCTVQSTNIRIKLNIMHAHRTTVVDNNPLGIVNVQKSFLSKGLVV